MQGKRISKEQAEEAVRCLEAVRGNMTMAAKISRVSITAFRNRILSAEVQYGLTPNTPPESQPDPLAESQKLVSHLRDQIKVLNKDIERLEGERLSDDKVRSMILDCDQPPGPPKWKVSNTAGKNTGIPTLLLSDWHWWEVVDPAQINHVNAFNKAIGHRRAKALFSTAINLLIHHIAKPQYDYICVPIGGDMISGNIHDELRSTNEGEVSRCMMDLIDVLIAGIDLLLEHFKKVYLPCVVGNHSRWDKKPRFKGRAYESFEWILYQFLAKHYAKDDRVHFEIADGADLPYQLHNTRYLLTHGDQFKGGTGISGALAPLMLGDARKRKRAMAVNAPYEYMVMGHWHQYIHAKGIIVNSSLKGFDELALQNNWEFELPGQALWITHPEWGITARWPVYLERQGTKF